MFFWPTSWTITATGYYFSPDAPEHRNPEPLTGFSGEVDTTPAPPREPGSIEGGLASVGQELDDVATSFEEHLPSILEGAYQETGLKSVVQAVTDPTPVLEEAYEDTGLKSVVNKVADVFTDEDSGLKSALSTVSDAFSGLFG